MTTSQPAAGGPPQQTPSSMVRASDGKTRTDTPNQTVITNPVAQHAILLDHVKKFAHVVPLVPQPPQMPQMPQVAAPKPPGTPQMPPVTVQDLGKSMIEGHPVEGKRYTVQPPAPPPLPQPPAPPQLPQAPNMPQAPQAPQVQAPKTPAPPPMPTVSEVWTSIPLQVPVLTKITTPAGVQTTYCKPAPMAEPDPSLFQIPPGYQVFMPKKA